MPVVEILLTVRVDDPVLVGVDDGLGIIPRVLEGGDVAVCAPDRDGDTKAEAVLSFDPVCARLTVGSLDLVCGLVAVRLGTRRRVRVGFVVTEMGVTKGDRVAVRWGVAESSPCDKVWVVEAEAALVGVTGTVTEGRVAVGESVWVLLRVREGTGAGVAVCWPVMVGTRGRERVLEVDSVLVWERIMLLEWEGVAEGVAVRDGIKAGVDVGDGDLVEV